MKGKIKFWNPAKGFGFIETEKGRDIFFHVEEFKELRLNLKEEVEFEVKEDKKGDKATNIKRIK